MPPLADTFSVTNFVSNLGIALIVAIVTSVISVSLAIRRFRQERWWDRRADAYASILNALHVAKRGSEDDLSWFTNPDRVKDPEREREVTKRSHDAWDNIHKAIDTAEFLMSSEAAEALRSFKRESDQADEAATFEGHTEPTLSIEGTIKAIERCIKLLTPIARRDLKID